VNIMQLAFNRLTDCHRETMRCEYWGPLYSLGVDDKECTNLLRLVKALKTPRSRYNLRTRGYDIEVS